MTLILSLATLIINVSNAVYAFDVGPRELRKLVVVVSMTNDFYCDEVLSGRTPVTKIFETADVLAFHHTRPFYPVHVVVIPKRHVDSLLTLAEQDNDLLLELISVIRRVAVQIVNEHGACRVLTNLGDYQESKHLHWHVASGEPLG